MLTPVACRYLHTFGLDEQWGVGAEESQTLFSASACILLFPLQQNYSKLGNISLEKAETGNPDVSSEFRERAVPRVSGETGEVCDRGSGPSNFFKP